MLPYKIKDQYIYIYIRILCILLIECHLSCAVGDWKEEFSSIHQIIQPLATELCSQFLTPNCSLRQSHQCVRVCVNGYSS